MWKRPPLQREGGLCPLNSPSSQLQWHPYPRSSVLKRTFPVSLKSRQIGSLQGQPGEATGKLLTPDCTQKTESGKTEREMANLDSSGQPGFPTHIHTPSNIPTTIGLVFKASIFIQNITAGLKTKPRQSKFMREIHRFWLPGHFRVIPKIGELTGAP